MPLEGWDGPDGPLAQHLRDEIERSLKAYREKPKSVTEHANIELVTAQGGYGRKQLLELIQNGADALTSAGLEGSGQGRIEARLTEDFLYVANEGTPLTPAGVDALTLSNMSDKADQQIGRFGLGFKSVVQLSDSVEIISRSLSIRFERESARQQLESVLGPIVGPWPILRLPEPFDPNDIAEQDEHLNELMSWATTVVRLRLRESSDWLRNDFTEFPGQFLLFSPQIQALVLRDVRDGGQVRQLAVISDQGSERVLSVDGKLSYWSVRIEEHKPSSAARSDAGKMAKRDHIRMVWAVPTEDRTGIGRLWAFFPTHSFATLGGIINAPWKLSPDRQTLIEGTFNEELLTDVLPKLVASSVPDLIDHKDPASILDVYPARGRESRSWADDVLNGPVVRSLQRTACIPDALGVLRLPHELRVHPEALRDSWKALWLEGAPRPAQWVHHSIDDRGAAERRAKVARLAASDETATIAEWLQALTSGPDPVVGSKNSLRLARRIIREEPKLLEACRSAAIVLTTDGSLVPPIKGRVFLGGTSDSSSTTSFVHPDLIEDPDVVELFEMLGISQLDLAGTLHSILGGMDLDRPDPSQWEKFWRASAQIDSDLVQKILGEHIEDPWMNCLVKTKTGDWKYASQILLPGSVIPEGSASDGHGCLDNQFHRGNLRTLRGIGMSDRPELRAPGLDDEWFDTWREHTVNAYRHGLPKGVSVPKPENVSVDEHLIPSHLDLLSTLSESGREAMTTIVLAFLRPAVWKVRAAGRPEQAVADPVIALVLEHGRIPTSLGPRQARQAFAPVPGLPEDLFPVARAADLLLGELMQGLEDLTPEAWSELLLSRAQQMSTDQRGRLYALAVKHTDPPTTLWAEDLDGQREVPTTQACAVATTEDFHILREQGIAVVRVSNAAEAEELHTAWGLEPAARHITSAIHHVPSRDPLPLLDLLPALRDHTNDPLDQYEVVPCEEIEFRRVTPGGQETQRRDFLLLEEQIYTVDLELGPLLNRINTELGLGVSDAYQQIIVHESSRSANRHRTKGVREAKSDDERLLLAVGEDELRRAIPAAAITLIEQDEGPLRGVELAAAARAALGLEVLTTLKTALERRGLEPPSRWAGSGQARGYVTDLGFDAELAGFSGGNRDAMVDVDGPVPLPDLHEYQVRVADRIRRVLRGEDKYHRGMVSLPTGAGKTRVAVEAVVRAVAFEGLSGPVLWLAQSDELCEQAVQTWSLIWRSVGPPERLRVSRLWAGNDAEPYEDGCHVVVATDDKMTSIFRRDEYRWLREASVVIIDEAHTSISQSYTPLLEWLGRGRSRASGKPLIGLSATPFRGVSSEETQRLVGRYDSNLLTDDAFEGDPHEELQEMGVLARVRHEVLQGAEIDLSADELRELRERRRVAPSLQDRLGKDDRRNRTIVESILELPSDWTVLLFAPSVDSARALAAVLSHKGVPAMAVSGETDRAARRHYVDQFRKKELRVLTNYGVFAQGFDAPAVRAVYVTRPTFTPNLYQQMIGRGLRGPLNGGSDEVLIVNVDDNFRQFGEQLAFHHFDYLWQSR
ncbi:DEAD/DEAH box helicase [Kineosporia babensis]|uniref:DEAD/DEAH box helicase family protein n=1 Tax=Kineosporia babensis TaxID=499548 RepID=A0A9X1NL59_9ACTN|nr:DEAD/DEAH box helicase family protein [Kineosporia babensis]MCD5317047.1 DEAD/DEAH box helicase family protein [Kineosporia babensis]